METTTTNAQVIGTEDVARVPSTEETHLTADGRVEFGEIKRRECPDIFYEGAD